MPLLVAPVITKHSYQAIRPGQIKSTVIGYPVGSCSSFTNGAQHAKKVMSDSPRLEDFAIVLVNSVLNFPEGQVGFLGNSNYRRTVINTAYQRLFWAS